MRFDLGDLVLDDGTRQLLRGTDELRLSPKAFDFLALLLRERPNVVTKAQLHERIWAGVFVSDASIAMVASEVRAALGESARAQRRIRTAHGHGYAFAGSVKLDPALAAGAADHWLVVSDRLYALRQGDNIVGREPGVDVWIDAPSVSRRHACLGVNGADATVDDLASKNGTFASNQPVVGPTPLTNGTEVRFGSAVAVYRRSADQTT